MSDSVPNTSSFTLQNVIAVVGGSSLSQAFTNSTDSCFDATYKGSKNRQTNFRNYIASLTVNYISYDGLGSTRVAIRSSVTGSNITARGVCWVAGTGTPTTANTKTETATSSGSSLPLACTGLSASTQYTFRPYAKTASNTYYGSTVTITTQASSQAFTSSTTWTCPTGVTNIEIECWGAGGTGGPATGNPTRSGGGAGGCYAKKMNVTVSPGTGYAITVASASTANTTTAVNGGDSSFTTVCVAKGGIGGAAASGTSGNGATAVTTGCVGDVIYAGGNGGNGTAGSSSGGGGGGAGSTGVGNNASGATAGTSKSNNGGAGGAGVSTANTRNNGSNYGGGGSGGLSSSSTDGAGGNGAAGYVVINYY